MAVEFLSDNTQCYSKSTIDMMTQKQELEEQSQLPIPEVVICPECFTPDSSVTCAGYDAGLRGYRKFKFVCHEYHFKPYKCACCGSVFVQTKHQKTHNIAHPILWWVAGISIIASLVLLVYSIYAASLIGFLALPVFLIGAMVDNICKNIDYDFTKADKITEDTLFQEMSDLFETEFQHFEHSVTRDKQYIEKRALYVGEEQATMKSEAVEETEEDIEQESMFDNYAPKTLAERQSGKVRKVEVPLHSTRFVEEPDGSATEVHETVPESYSTVVQEPDGGVYAYDVTTERIVKCQQPMPLLNDVDTSPTDYGMQNNPVNEVNVLQLTIDTLRREGSE